MGVHSRLSGKWIFYPHPPFRQPLQPGPPHDAFSCSSSDVARSLVVPFRAGASLLAVLFGGATLLRPGPRWPRRRSPRPPRRTDEAAPPDESAQTRAARRRRPATRRSRRRSWTPRRRPPRRTAWATSTSARPNAEGLGRVAVKAAPESKIKIFLEGRYFGTAPLTIYSVPRATTSSRPCTRTASRCHKPVSVGENEETAVDLAAPRR